MCPGLVANRGLGSKSAPDGPLRIGESSRDRRWLYAEFGSNSELGPAPLGKGPSSRSARPRPIHRRYVKVANSRVVSGMKKAGSLHAIGNTEKAGAFESDWRCLDPANSKGDRG